MSYEWSQQLKNGIVVGGDWFFRRSNFCASGRSDQVRARTGWYVANTHPPYVKGRSTEELCGIMVHELTEGVGQTGIRAGVIGECGCSYPFHANEKKVLAAAVLAQRETGAPIVVHPALMDLARAIIGVRRILE